MSRDFWLRLELKEWCVNECKVFIFLTQVSSLNLTEPKILDMSSDICVYRMDGAWLGSVDIAIKKAKTAIFFQMNTEVIGSLSQPGGSLYNIEHSNSGLISFPGGLPLTTGDGMIGGIGVSGSTVENDKEVAEAAAKILATM